MDVGLVSRRRDKEEWMSSVLAEIPMSLRDLRGRDCNMIKDVWVGKEVFFRNLLVSHALTRIME